LQQRQADIYQRIAERRRACHHPRLPYRQASSGARTQRCSWFSPRHHLRARDCPA
jgi:hypothetical protein